MSLKRGQIYEVVEGWSFEVANLGVISTYDPGDEIKLIQHTSQDPNNTGSTDNWVVETKHGVSIWTRLPRLIRGEYIKLKE
jgi:hypothetical protein